MNLSHLQNGQDAVVAGVNGTGPVMMRLMEIGLIPGRKVSVLRRAAFGGPIEILIDRTRVAVRSAEAACVELAGLGHSVEDHASKPSTVPALV